MIPKHIKTFFLQIFSLVLLAVVLSASGFLSLPARSAVGVAQKLSYQGFLTDTAGSPLGGDGQNYCMKFSIYDAPIGGNRLWPQEEPEPMTVLVKNGIFNAEIGGPGILDFNFYDSEATYLEVSVNEEPETCSGRYESLSPRQRILSAGYALVAQNVFGDLLKTEVDANVVRIGSGAGSSPLGLKYLALDVANVAQNIGDRCSPSGSLWYNSNASNRSVLACEDGRIRSLGSGSSKNLGSAVLARDSKSITVSLKSADYVVCYLSDAGVSSEKAQRAFRLNEDASSGAYQWTLGSVSGKGSQFSLSGSRSSAFFTIRISGLNSARKNILADGVIESLSGAPQRAELAGWWQNSESSIESITFLLTGEGEYRSGTAAWCEGQDID